MASDPEPSRSKLVARTTQARVQSRALRKLVADAAEEVARVEDEVARVHESIAGQGGPLAEQARAHAARARAVAAREHGAAELQQRLGHPEPAAEVRGHAERARGLHRLAVQELAHYQARIVATSSGTGEAPTGSSSPAG